MRGQVSRGWVLGLALWTGFSTALFAVPANLEVKLAPLAEALGAPTPGLWRDHYPKDGGQTFDQFRAFKRNQRRTAAQSTIYFGKMGEFSPEKSEILELTREYSAIFYGIPVEYLGPFEVLDEMFVKQEKQNRQLLTNYFTESWMPPRKPANALAYLMFTNEDLTMKSEERLWNFVFGVGDMYKAVGIFSIVRFGDPTVSPEMFRTVLRRALKTASHEIAHMLGIPHCTSFRCLMNGSISLTEFDTVPLHLCPVCERKIEWYFGDTYPARRARALKDFLNEKGFPSDAEYYAKAIPLLTRP